MELLETQPALPVSVLRRHAVEQRSGLSKSEIYAKMARDEFPKPIRLGSGAVGWIEAEINAWLASRPRCEIGKKRRAAA